jgi:IS605 OrfB family transposase
VGNAVKLYVKKNFMQLLNQRYIADAVSNVTSIKMAGNVFGGKVAWGDLQSGEMSKQEWQERRNNQLYSRGDRTKSGNPNIRVVGDKLLIKDHSAIGRWIEGRLFIPNKWRVDAECYNVRLIYRNEKFEVKVSWEETAGVEILTTGGAVGIDCNPDGIAVVEVNADGNLVRHMYEKEQRIQFAGRGKRDYDIKQMAVRAVDVAKESQKILIVEKLAFGKRKNGVRKFRRMKSNFIYRQMLDAVKSRASREGVPVIEVQPAFTSILGNLKYAKQYSLNRHTAAALVIGRRGLGFLERHDFTVTQEESGSGKLNLEGRGFKHTLTPKAYSWLEDCFIKPKQADLTGPVLAPGLRPGIGISAGEIPAGESGLTTGQLGNANSILGEERLPSDLGRFTQAS